MSNEKKRILVVDDMRTMQSILPVYLVGRYLDFFTANSGAEGIELARKIIPHLIISDIQMPDIDGLKFCTLIRTTAKLRDVPIILMSTTLHDPVVRSKGTSAGASAMIGKPIDAKELCQAVDSLLGIESKT